MHKIADFKQHWSLEFDAYLIFLEKTLLKNL
jgi:hypothetical protein